GRDGDVFVRIVEAGDDRPAAGIDDRGVRVGEAAQRVVRAHGGNALAADGDGFGRRQFGIAGEHCAVAEQRIHAGGQPPKAAVTPDTISLILTVPSPFRSPAGHAIPGACPSAVPTKATSSLTATMRLPLQSPAHHPTYGFLGYSPGEQGRGAPFP